MKPSLLSLKMRAEDALLAGKITRSEFDIYMKTAEQEYASESTPIATPSVASTTIATPTVTNIPSTIDPPNAIVTKPLADIPEMDLPTFTTPTENRASTRTAASTSSRQPENKNGLFLGALIVIAMIGIFGIMQLTGESGAPAGLAILTLPQENFTNTTIPVPYIVVGLRVTGLLHGDGNATMILRTTTGDLLIASLTSDTGAPMTDKAGYDSGETVNIVNAPSDATYYLDDGIASTQVTVPFPAPSSDATLLIVANESGELATYRLPIHIGTTARTIAFTSLCEDTCSIPATEGDIVITTTGDAHVELTTVEVTTDDNRAPILTTPFPTLDINETTIIDLSAHFTDADGDELLYSTSSSDIANLVIEGSTLTITPLADGTAEIAIYASDLKELVPASMTLTVRMPTTVDEPIINDTATDNNTETPTDNTTEPPEITPPVDIPLNDTNSTETPSTPPAALDCSSANPNERPAECLLNTTTNYFPDQDIYWETDDRERIARFSTVGNLLITGGVEENDPTPSPSYDFSIGYYDFETYIPTIWIDNEGHLHLRGLLHEESQNFIPPPGSYSFNNKRGVTLAYADLQTGDLYLRGNLIPYRRSIE